MRIANGLDARGQHVRKLHGLTLEFQLAGGNAPHVHEIVHKPHEVRELALHHVDGPTRSWIVAQSAQSGDLQAVQQRRQRVAKLMRQRGEEHVLALVGRTQRRLGFTALGYIQDELHHLVAEAPCSEQSPPARPVLAEVLLLVRRRLTLGGHFVDRVPRLGVKLGRCQFLPGLAHRLLAPEAGHAQEGVVHRGETEPLSPEHDADGLDLENGFLALLGFAPRRYVVEQHRDEFLVWLAEPEGVYVEPTPHRLCMFNETGRRARARHVPIDVEPLLLEVRHQLSRRPTLPVDDAGLPFERRVDLLETVVHGSVQLIENHLEHAKAFIDGLEERLIATLARLQRPTLRLPQGFLREHLLRGFRRRAIEASHRAAVVAQRGP